MIRPGLARRHGTVLGALLAALALAAPAAQSPQLSRPSSRDLIRDLAAKVAATLTRTEPFEVTVVAGEAPGFDPGGLRAEILAQLKARGLRPAAGAPKPTLVRTTCGGNLQETVCSAEVVREDRSTVLLVTRPRVAEEQPGPLEPSTVLGMQPVFAQSRPILDVVLFAPHRAAVLDPQAVTLYERTEKGWTAHGSQPVQAAVPWPRDLRGRMRVRPPLVEVFLPGQVCRGTVEPFTLSCVAAADGWPLGIENDGVAGGRNYFTSPHLEPFYAAAPLGGATPTAWLVAGVDGRLRQVDPSFRVLATFRGAGDEVVALAGPCAGGRRLFLSLSAVGGEHPSSLQAWEISGQQRVAVTPPLPLPGDLVALWPTDDEALVLAITRDPESERHEAFHVGLSCAR